MKQRKMKLGIATMRTSSASSPKVSISTPSPVRRMLTRRSSSQTTTTSAAAVPTVRDIQQRPPSADSPVHTNSTGSLQTSNNASVSSSSSVGRRTAEVQQATAVPPTSTTATAAAAASASSGGDTPSNAAEGSQARQEIVVNPRNDQSLSSSAAAAVASSPTSIASPPRGVEQDMATGGTTTVVTSSNNNVPAASFHEEGGEGIIMAKRAASAIEVPSLGEGEEEDHNNDDGPGTKKKLQSCRPGHNGGEKIATSVLVLCHSGSSGEDSAPPSSSSTTMSVSSPAAAVAVVASGTITTTLTTAAKKKLEDMHVLTWLLEEAPYDLVPRVFSFLGPRKARALSRVNKRWSEVAKSEPVWRTMCEDTGKWKEGTPIPVSWLEYYRDNPCVPLDYGTINAALVATRTNKGRPREHCRNVRILVHPGRYVTKDSLVFNTFGSASVTVETLQTPYRLRPSRTQEQLMGDSAATLGDVSVVGSSCSSNRLSPSRASRQLTRRISSILSGCRSSSVDESTHRDAAHAGMEGNGAGGAQPAAGSDSSTVDGVNSASSGSSPAPEKASIILKTRKHNKPVVRIQQGTLKLININVVHSCHGTDIWNGNAAVQIQPPFDDNGDPVMPAPPCTQPTAVMMDCDIVSASGRGVVAIDGGSAVITRSYIHNCAATGIYVGGRGSVATIGTTDVTHNGNGNESNQRGIARGHSGIYLEQGMATVRDCNVSHNSLTGLSAISSDNATLLIEGTDLVGNGSMQLEMPPEGSVSRRRSVSRNNSTAREGFGRSRSGLIRDSSGRLLSPGRESSTEFPGALGLGAMMLARRQNSSTNVVPEDNAAQRP